MEFVASRPSSVAVLEPKLTLESGSHNTESGNTEAHVRGPRKRKEDPTELCASDTIIFNYKRSRQDDGHTRSWPSNKRTAIKFHKKGGAKIPVISKCIQPNDHPCVVTKIPYGGQEVRAKKDYGLHGAEDTSIIGSGDGQDVNQSGPGNTSTLTAFSNEEGESRLVRDSGQSSKFLSQNKDGIVTFRHNESKHLPSSTLRETQSSSRDEHSDGEVLSPPSRSFTTRHTELNRIFGLNVWELSYGTVCGEKAGTACVMDPERSGSEARKPETVRDTVDYSCSKRHHDRSSMQEHQSDSVITDLCLSIGSSSTISGRRRGSFKRHRLKEPSRGNEVEGKCSGLLSNVVAGGVGGDGMHVTVEPFSRFEAAFDGLHPESRPPDAGKALEQHYLEYSSRPMEKSSHVDTKCPGKDGGELPKVEPVFVLSSGRLSKEQEEKLGVRPTTIDDDFDRYFAQLML